MLAAQSALFVWMVDQTAGSIPARSPRRLAVIVASDVAAALDADPALDLQRYVREQYAHVFQPFVVVMRDGRVASNRDEVPEELKDAVAFESARRDFPPREGRGGRGDRGGARSCRRRTLRRSRRRWTAPATERTGTVPLPPERSWEAVPMFVAGEPVGRVAVLAGPPFSRIASELGPTVAVVAAGVLAVGMVLIALFVFGPAQRRLKKVQEATEQLGAGDLNARAPEKGGDEVAAVARSFNRMADELASRAQALDASDRARRQLLADVSHELMTPLTAMRGYVETLTMREVPLDQATRERYLRIIDEETHRLERIVGDLLDLAKLEGGGGTLRHERVPLRGALRSRALTARARERRARDPDRVSGRAGRGNRRGRSRSSGAGAAEPGGKRAAAHAGRRRDHACRRRSRTAPCTCACATPAAASRRSICRSSSSASTRPTAPGAPPVAAASVCRSSRRSSSGTTGRSRRPTTTAPSSTSPCPVPPRCNGDCPLS